MHPVVPTLGLIMPNDFPALASAQQCFVLLSRSFNPCTAPHPPHSHHTLIHLDYNSQGACLFFSFFTLKKTATLGQSNKKNNISSCPVRWVITSNWVPVSLQSSQNTTSRPAASNGCRIRRDYGGVWFPSAVSVSLSLWQTPFSKLFVCVNYQKKKMSSTTILDGGKQRDRLGSEGDRRRSLFRKGFGSIKAGKKIKNTPKKTTQLPHRLSEKWKE